MRIKTNLPKAIVYKEPQPAGSVSFSFRPNALVSSDNLIKVIYAGGYFVAIGKTGTVAYSEAGQTWVTKKLGEYTFHDIEYAQGKYIIVGETDSCGVIVYSENLANWTVTTIEPVTTGYNIYLHGIMYNGEKFIIFSAEDDQSYNHDVYTCLTSDLTNLERTKFAKGMPSSDDPVRYASIKGNNRIVLIQMYSTRNIDAYCTADGVDVDKAILDSRGCEPGYPFYYCFGTFMQGPVPGGPTFYMSSINSKDWVKTKWASSKTGIPHFIGAIHINDYTLYVGENDGLIVGDAEALIDKSSADCFSISPSAIINGVACSEKGIVCVGNGGVVFYAALDSGSKEMEIEPSTVSREIYIRKSDNIRTLHIKPVTSRIDGNLIPENIKKGVTILGINGTYTAGNADAPVE